MKKLLSLMLAVMLVLSCLSGLCFAADAEATWTNGLTTAEGTLADMVKKASASGGTITLLKDVSHTNEKALYAINSNSSFTLDLNGHTITSVTGAVCIAEGAKGTVGTTVIKNGTIIGKTINVSVHKGALQMDGVTCWAETKQNIIYNNTDGSYNKDNLIQNCTIGNAAWGAFSFNNTKADQSAVTMTFKNSTLLTTAPKSQVLVKQKAAGAPAVLLGEGLKMYCVGENKHLGSGINAAGETVTKAEGTHTVEIAGNTAENMTLWTTPETATVELVAPAAPETPAAPSGAATVSTAKASWTNGLSSASGSLKEMVSQAGKQGGVVTMEEDAVYEGEEMFALSASGVFTLDMNGHTLTSAKGGVNIQNKGKEGVFVLKNGTMICNGQCNVNMRGAGVQIIGMTMWAETNQNINYYVAEDTYNKDNIIENSTLGNPIWYVLSFNDNKVNQEKASFTVKNSTLICAKTKGHAVLGLQTKPEGSTANLVLGEGVKLYTYAKGPFASALNILGETVTASGEPASVTILDKTYDIINEFTTPATATVDLAAVIPGNTPAHDVAAPAAPATPSTPSTPEKPAEDKKEEGKQPTVAPTITPVDEGGMNAGVIIAIVAAVVVAAAVVLVVLKKKKK